MKRSAKMTWVVRIQYVLRTQGMCIVTVQGLSHLRYYAV